jgi:hypothetical protein
MPRGIVVKVSPEEIKPHLEKRVAYHEERSRFYFAEAKRHKDEMDRLQALGEFEMNAITKSSYNNSRTLQESNRTEGIRHHNTGKRLKYILEHLYDEAYEFSLGDLQSLEFISEAY